MLPDLPVEARKAVGKAAHRVDDPLFHGLLPVEDAAHIRGHVVLFQHEGREILPADAAVAGDEVPDPVLEPLEIVVRLGRGDDHAAHAHRVDGHGGGGHGEAVSGRHRQGDPNGVAASQDDGDGGLCHPGDQLRDGKPCLHIAADRVQKEQDTVHFLRFLQLGKKGQHVLVFGGLGGIGGHGVALDLADDGQAVHVSVSGPGHGGPEVQDGLGHVPGVFVLPVLPGGPGGLGGF